MILSGISQLTLYDNTLVSENDLSSNFFATKEDINTNSLADITQRGLMELNNFAIVMIYKGELANNFTILNETNLVIITEIISLETAENLNQYCNYLNVSRAKLKSIPQEVLDQKDSMESLEISGNNFNDFYSVLRNKLHWGISPVCDK